MNGFSVTLPISEATQAGSTFLVVLLEAARLEPNSSPHTTTALFSALSDSLVTSHPTSSGTTLQRITYVLCLKTQTAPRPLVTLTAYEMLRLTVCSVLLTAPRKVLISFCIRTVSHYWNTTREFFTKTTLIRRIQSHEFSIRKMFEIIIKGTEQRVAVGSRR